MASGQSSYIIEPSAVRLFTFAAIMASANYIPIFAEFLKMANTEIGLLVSFYSFALFLSSLIFGRASDRYGRKLFLIFGLLLSAIAFLLQIFAQDFLSLMAIRSFIGLCIGIYPASLVAYVHETKQNLSKFSAFGSLGWAFGSLTGGVVATYFMFRGVFVFSSLMFILAFLFALKMRFGKHIPMKIPRFPMKIVKKNWLLYISILIRHSGAHMIWAFWPLFLMSLGADLFWVGVIQTINSAIQFVFMYTLSGRIKYEFSIALGFVLSSVTFFSFTLAKDFWQIIPTQFLLGASWSLMYVGGLRYLMHRNIEKATVSGLFDSALSLSAIIGPIMATFVIQFGGFIAIMYVASALSLVSFFLFRFSKQSEYFGRLHWSTSEKRSS